MFSFQELQTGTYLQNSFFELWSGTALFRSLIHFYSTIFDKFMIQGRTKYQQMKSQLRAGDIVIVKSIDRFGRNYAEICKEWESIISMGVDIQVLDMPILNTRDNQNGLTGRLITDIVLKLLGYVAERERDNIKTRQREGIDSALARGVRFGRPSGEIPKDFIRCYELYKQGLIKVKDVMSMCNIKRSTFFKYAQSIKS